MHGFSLSNAAVNAKGRSRVECKNVLDLELVRVRAATGDITLALNRVSDRTQEVAFENGASEHAVVKRIYSSGSGRRRHGSPATIVLDWCGINFCRNS